MQSPSVVVDNYTWLKRSLKHTERLFVCEYVNSDNLKLLKILHNTVQVYSRCNRTNIPNPPNKTYCSGKKETNMEVGEKEERIA